MFFLYWRIVAANIVANNKCIVMEGYSGRSEADKSHDDDDDDDV